MSQMIIEATPATVSEKDEIFFKSKYTNQQVMDILRHFQKHGDEKSSAILLEIFNKQAWDVARRYLKSGILREDAYQSAIEGLYAAAKGFDTELKGIIPFKGYVRQSMFDHLNQQVKGYTIKIGTAASYHVWEIKKMMETHGIDAEEACNRLGLSKRKRTARLQAMNAVGLSGISTEMEKTLARGKNPTYEEIEKQEELRIIQENIKKLPANLKTVLEMRIDGHPVKEIAKKLEVSIPTISNWFKKACKIICP